YNCYRYVLVNDSSWRLVDIRFQLVQLRRKKCIQFSDDLGRKFSLKAVNGTSVTFEAIFMRFVVLMMKIESRTSLQYQTLWRLQSHFRLHKPCKGGNLVKIAVQQCTVFEKKKRCEARCNGSSTKDPSTSK
ncbi:unnamed protein product, partial [Pocillopora meandrina]